MLFSQHSVVSNRFRPNTGSSPFRLPPDCDWPDPTSVVPAHWAGPSHAARAAERGAVSPGAPCHCAARMPQSSPHHCECFSSLPFRTRVGFCLSACLTMLSRFRSSCRVFSRVPPSVFSAQVRNVSIELLMDFLVTLGSVTVCGSLRVTLLSAKQPASAGLPVFFQC